MRQVSEATQQLLQRLFDFTAKTSSFFQSSLDAEIVRVLEEVAEQGEAGAISGVVNCLFYPSAVVKAAASRTIHAILNRLPPELLRHLGEMVN